MSAGSSIPITDCPKCKMPIAAVSPLRAGGTATVCPFCSHNIEGRTGEADRGAIIGWRGVSIRGTGPDGRPRIWSPVCPLEWKPGVTMVATCHGVPLPKCPHRLAGDKAPQTSCSCGFYAARTRDYLLTLGYGHYSTPDHPDSVLCEVEQWGRVVVAWSGYRAENVRLKRIYVPSDGQAWIIAKMLEEDYAEHGCEVVLADTLNMPVGSIPTYCRSCGAKMKGGSAALRNTGGTLTCKWCGEYNDPEGE